VLLQRIGIFSPNSFIPSLRWLLRNSPSRFRDRLADHGIAARRMTLVTGQGTSDSPYCPAPVAGVRRAAGSSGRSDTRSPCVI